MSYNVSHVHVLKLDASMMAKDLLRLVDEESLPESNFIEEHVEKANPDNPNELIPLEDFLWCGEGSGWGVDALEDEIAPLIKGTVEVVLVWEGGDCLEGIRIQDGHMTRHEVKLELI